MGFGSCVCVCLLLCVLVGVCVNHTGGGLLFPVWLPLWQPGVVCHAYGNMQEWAWNQGQAWKTMSRHSRGPRLSAELGTARAPLRLQPGVTHHAHPRKPVMSCWKTVQVGESVGRVLACGLR